MSTPGPGGPRPPEQHPGRLGGWNQQLPADWRPRRGEQSWGGADDVTQRQDHGRPTSVRSPSGRPQSGRPQSGRPRSGRPPTPQRNWLPIVAGIIGLIVVLNVVRGLTAGEPEAGDCMQQSGPAEFDTVDCSSDEAEFRVLGTEADMTGAEFDATDPNELCGDFAEATSVFWYGSDDGSDGAVYCAEAV